MANKCIFFCSVQHKLLDELLVRLSSEGVDYKVVDCTYVARTRMQRILAVFYSLIKVLKESVFSRREDLLVFHYLSAQAFLAIPILVLLNKRIVLHFWGTDYAKFKGLRNRRLMKFFIKKLSAITFANEFALNEFKSEFPKSNVHKLTFGLEAIDFIDICMAEGWGQGESAAHPVVVCGTNSSPNQQLIEIIDILDAWGGHDNFKFVFPLAYGDPSYKKMVEQRLLRSSLSYEVKDEFMVGEQLAQFRLSAAILIQVQKNDFLSGAMLEYAYAGVKIITGKWLPYNQIRSKGIEWFEIENLSDLPEAIALAEQSTINIDMNREIIAGLARWHEVIKQWKGLYQA